MTLLFVTPTKQLVEAASERNCVNLVASSVAQQADHAVIDCIITCSLTTLVMRRSQTNLPPLEIPGIDIPTPRYILTF